MSLPRLLHLHLKLNASRSGASVGGVARAKPEAISFFMEKLLRKLNSV
jgi:hypothetical protein